MTNGSATEGTAAAARKLEGNGNSELARAMSVKTNDQLMAIYLSSLIRAITAFHDLIENKIQNRQQQEEKDAKKEKGEAAGVKNGEGKNGEGKKANGVNGEVEEGGKGEEKKEKGKEADKKR